MITIKEIAKLADVSPTTVSNVLHGRTKKVSPDTLDRVRKVLGENNYVSNMGAEMLGHKRSRIIALILAYNNSDRKNIITNPFVASIVNSVETAVQQNGFFLMLYSNPNIDECLKMAKAWMVDGIILLGAKRQGYYRLRNNLSTPIVSIDTYFAVNDTNYVNVGLDDYGGEKAMVNYLINEGHTKIGFLSLMQFERINENGVMYVDLSRLEGYKDALKEAGLPISADWYESLKFNQTVRRKQWHRWRKNDFYGCTAICFGSDLMALEAMMYFEDHGYKIPDDLTITGFDGIFEGDIHKPRLTTVYQDVNERGCRAVTEILKLINDPDSMKDKNRKVNIVMPTRLLLKETVKKISESN